MTVANAWATPRVRQFAGPAISVSMTPVTVNVTVPVPTKSARTAGSVTTCTCSPWPERLYGVGTSGVSVCDALSLAVTWRSTEPGPLASSLALNESADELDTDERFSTIACTDPSIVAVTVS